MSVESKEKLYLYTFETTVIDKAGKLADPYQRVVGLSKSGDEPTWETATPDCGHAAPKELAASEIELDVTSVFADRVVSFFQLYFTSHRGQIDPASPHAQYNCHRFARWVRNDSDSMTDLGISPPDWVPALVNPVDDEYKLDLGQEGVLGARKPIVGTGEAAHSVVGLGQESSYCLGVMGVNGFIGYETYEDALRGVRENNPDQNIALYPVPL